MSLAIRYDLFLILLNAWTLPSGLEGLINEIAGHMLIGISRLHVHLLRISKHLSSPEPKAQDEVIGWDSSRHPSMRHIFKYKYL